MQKPVLEVKPREVVGKKVKAYRKEGLLPAVVYGHKFNSQSLLLDAKNFEKLYKEAGSNTVIELTKPEAKGSLNVLVQAVQYDVVKGNLIHVDFYRVKMDEKITTNIPIHFVGESAAVRDLDGMLITNRDEVEVECLPGDLISEIEVDISVLTDFEGAIHVSDLKLPDTIKILTEPEETVATVEPPRSEEELAELDEAIEVPELPESEQGAPEEAEQSEENKE